MEMVASPPVAAGMSTLLLGTTGI
uniref:Uncharacterized protein n=1 Tax=Anguilla anguilla TaxID=7936 RepID=A0A0E9PXG0_ANGAN